MPHCCRQPAGDELGCITGDCVNGKGTLVEETERGIRTYRGDFIDGKFHGFGRLTYEDEREHYKGRFMSGKKWGRGTLWDRNGNIYMGEWRNDRRNGSGLQAFKVQGWKEDRYTENWLKENSENYYGQFKNDVFFMEKVPTAGRMVPSMLDNGLPTKNMVRVTLTMVPDTRPGAILNSTSAFSMSASNFQTNPN